MKKLLHERLREYSEDRYVYSCNTKDLASVIGVDTDCRDLCSECCDRIYGTLADEIERYYIPREDHEREIKEVIEAQGRHSPAAHHIMQVWAKSHDMEWPDGASITKFLDHYYIPRPRFEDGEPVTVENRNEIEWEDGEEWLMTATSNDGIPMATFVNRRPLKAKMTPDGFVVRRHPKVYDADGVELKPGAIAWSVYSTRFGGAEVESVHKAGEKNKHGNVIKEDFVCYVESYMNGKEWDYAKNITQKEPDSLDKLLKDMNQVVVTYMGYETSQIAKFAKRLSDLVEKVD